MKWKNLIRKLLVAALWIGVWELVYLAVGQEILIASPFAVFVRLVQYLGEGSFYAAVGVSMGRILLGFGLALLFGVLLAVLTSFLPWARELFRPVLSMVKATPVASFIILALVWMSTATVPAFTSFLMVLPIVWANVSEGILHTDRQLLEMAATFRVSKGRILKQVYLPSVVPYFSAAAKTGMGLAWKAGIAAEVLCRPANSIGTFLYNAKIYLETTDLFTVTATIILLSVILEKGFVKFMAFAGRRYHIPERETKSL
ncbi:MAG: ABC transporter permease [Christensenellales bacterium]